MNRAVMQSNGIREAEVNRAKRVINAEGFKVQPLLLAEVMLVTLRAFGARPFRPQPDCPSDKPTGSKSSLSAAARLLSLLNATERHEPR
jgi:hypothetical protein